MICYKPIYSIMNVCDFPMYHSDDNKSLFFRRHWFLFIPLLWINKSLLLWCH